MTNKDRCLLAAPIKKLVTFLCAFWVSPGTDDAAIGFYLLIWSNYLHISIFFLSAVKLKACATSRCLSEANACWIQSICHQTVFIHSSKNSVNGGQVVEEKGEPIVFKTDQLSWAFVSNFLKKKKNHYYVRIVVSYTAINTVRNNLSWSAAEASAQNQAKAQLNCLNLKILSCFRGQQLHFIRGGEKKASERVSDQLTECNVKPWVSVEAAKHRARLGKQHLQRTVNMGKEQSGLFPLGIYSRGNEKKEREMRSHWG